MLTMKSKNAPCAIALKGTDGTVADLSIPRLVGKVYQSASPVERAHLLEPLLRPLGALSLLAIANGIFASIRFRSGWPDVQVRLEDIQNVRGADVIALVEYAQQVSIEAVDGLAKMLVGSPLAVGSAAAALLMTLLIQRARTRRNDTDALGASSALPA
jgi:hypothetical protein